MGRVITWFSRYPNVYPFQSCYYKATTVSVLPVVEWWHAFGSTHYQCPRGKWPLVLSWTCWWVQKDHWSWSCLDLHWILNNIENNAFWLSHRLFDHSMEGFKNWEFMTIHCWGERATGDWILEVYDTPSQLRNFKTPGRNSLFYHLVYSAETSDGIYFGLEGFCIYISTSSFLMWSYSWSICTYSSSQYYHLRGNDWRLKE